MQPPLCPHCGKPVQPYAPACWLCGGLLSWPVAEPVPMNEIAKVVGTAVLFAVAVAYAAFIALYVLCWVVIR
jgi:hypothetical protein